LTEVGTHEGIKGTTDEVAEESYHGIKRQTYKSSPIKNKMMPKTIETTGKEIAESAKAVPL
jgi:hypothetical protein